MLLLPFSCTNETETAKEVRPTGVPDRFIPPYSTNKTSPKLLFFICFLNMHAVHGCFFFSFFFFGYLSLLRIFLQRPLWDLTAQGPAMACMDGDSEETGGFPLVRAARVKLSQTRESSPWFLPLCFPFYQFKKGKVNSPFSFCLFFSIPMAAASRFFLESSVMKRPDPHFPCVFLALSVYISFCLKGPEFSPLHESPPFSMKNVILEFACVCVVHGVCMHLCSAWGFACVIQTLP